MGSKVEQITRVRGRLEQKLQFWKDLQVSLFVIDCIEEGYKLPLLYEPHWYRDANQGSTKAYEVFITEAVKELLEHGYVVQLSRCNTIHM